MNTRYASPSTGRPVQAVLFDTFGSVVDWRTGVAAAVETFMARHDRSLDSFAFADAWRDRYEPAMEPVRAGHRPFVPLDELHLENLTATMEQFGLDSRTFDLADIAHLNAAWERLEPWADSVEGIRLLGQQFIVGPLSNANSALLLRMARHAELPWSIIIGSDATRAYKPSRDAYLTMCHMLRLEPGEVMLAAAHNYDLAAARSAGLATAFIVRPTEFGAGQTQDLVPEEDWDVCATSIPDLWSQMSEQRRP